ncbi:MAG: hypothetical protein WC275_00010 [Bacilli bacterium]
MKENTLLFTIGAAIVLFLIVLFIMVLRLNKKDVKDDSIIIDNLTTPRIFVLDFLEEEVTYFDRGNYANRKKGPIPQFFEQFTAKEVEELDHWINRLLEKKSQVSLSYKVDVFVRSMRRSYASILEVKKIDYDKKVIHLESYLYRYLKPNDQSNLTVKKKEDIGYLSSVALARLYKRQRGRGRGVYGAINIVSTLPKQSQKIEIPPHIWYELQNQAAFYRAKNRIIRFLDNNTVGIYMPRRNDITPLIDIMKKIYTRVGAFLEKNGYHNFSIAIGIARARQFDDMKMHFKTAEELSMFAHREIGDIKMLIYDPAQEVKALDLSLYRNELMSIVRKKSVEPLFQPLIDSRSVEILGYLTSFQISGSLFASYKDLTTFARENKQNELLMKMVLRKTAATYHNVKRNNRHLLFIPISIDDVGFLSETFSTQPFASDLKIVFMLEEQDYAHSFDLGEEMSAINKKIKKMGYGIALIISNTELTLPDKIYGEVDYFMVNEQILSRTEGSERERLYLLSSLGKLLRHKRPITFIDLPKWSEIEYYIRAGADYVASDEISKKDFTLGTIDKKKALRIISFSKRK